MKRGIESRFTLIALSVFFLVMLVISIVYMVFIYNDQTGQTNLIAMNKRMQMSDVQMLKEADNQLNQSIIDLALLTNQSIFILGAITYQNITNLATETNNNFTAVYNVLNTLSNTTILTITQIQQNITNLDEAVRMRLLSVNQIRGDPDGNLGLLPGPGIDVSNSNSTNSITITNTGVVNLQGASGSVTMFGICSIGISAGPNNVTLDTCVLETGLNAVDMTVMNQQVQISVIETTLITQQMQIAAIIFAEQQFQEEYNGTVIRVNASITQMLADIELLKMQVAQLLAAQTNFTGTPVGAMLPWGGASNVIPQNFLLCDGSAISQGAYPDLFTFIGCAYCANPLADCLMGTFCLPDLRGKIPVGQRNPDPDGYFGVRGASVGEARHTMLLTELVSHAHTAQGVGNHVHDVHLGFGAVGGGQGGPFPTPDVIQGCFDRSTSETGVFANGPGPRYFGQNAYTQPCNTQFDDFGFFLEFEGRFPYLHGSFPFGGSRGNGALQNGAHTHTIDPNGGGQPFNVVQPSLVCGGYIIRAI